MTSTFSRFIIALGLMTLPFSLQAYPDCSFQIEDDTYYEFDRLRLNDKQQDQLDHFRERLDGDWRGELIQTECKGSIKHPYRQVDSSEVKLDIRTQPRNRLSMHADLDFTVQDKKVIYQRILFERPHLFSFLANGDNAFILTEKSYQRLSPLKGNVLIEITYKVLFKDDLLYLDIITFANGFFSIEERWKLYPH